MADLKVFVFRTQLAQSMRHLFSPKHQHYLNDGRDEHRHLQPNIHFSKFAVRPVGLEPGLAAYDLRWQFWWHLVCQFRAEAGMSRRVKKFPSC
jgi:hypothetical protein